MAIAELDSKRERYELICSDRTFRIIYYISLLLSCPVSAQVRGKSCRRGITYRRGRDCRRGRVLDDSA